VTETYQNDKFGPEITHVLTLHKLTMMINKTPLPVHHKTVLTLPLSVYSVISDMVWPVLSHHPGKYLCTAAIPHVPHAVPDSGPVHNGTCQKQHHKQTKEDLIHSYSMQRWCCCNT